MAAAHLRFRIDSLTPNAGPPVSVPPAGITCIVGGNNAGKSQILRDIVNCVTYTDARPLALTSVAHTKSGDMGRVDEWLRENSLMLPGEPGSVPVYQTPGGSSFPADHFARMWNEYSVLVGSIDSYFVWHATAGSLVTMATGDVGMPGMQTVGGPLNTLFRNGDLEAELSRLSHEVFGEVLTLDRINGKVQLRVGEPGVPTPPLNHPTLEYAEAVAGLPLLEHQGDGMKAFLGLALNVVAGAQQVLLVDEPEAFLHPAQARALGRWLATEASARDRQLVLATHDRDLVLGLLDAQAEVRLVRVSREGPKTTLHPLSEEQLKGVWDDPVLRYSNVLQGLFHEQVVVCEADADCRFYAAVLDVLATASGRRAVADGTLFVPSGGKGRVSVLASALSSVGVAAYAILDFDVLRERKDLQNILAALGGTWTDRLEEHYKVVVQHVNQKQAWGSVKHIGLNGMAPGATYKACEVLLGELAKQRLLVVPVGEMEDFDKSVDGHGSTWVSAMLEADGHSRCEAARRLMAPLAARTSLDLAT